MRRSSICFGVRCADRYTLPSIAYLLTMTDTTRCYTAFVRIIRPCFQGYVSRRRACTPALPQCGRRSHRVTARPAQPAAKVRVDASETDQAMPTETIALAPLEAHHLDGAVALSREAGWPHRREDWTMIWSLSEGRVALVVTGWWARPS
jgi:hypothetical protein